MRLGLFLSIFCALLCIVALVVPVPIGPEILAGGQPPRPGSAPVCLELAYERGHAGRWMPGTVRLVSAPAHVDSRWYRADGGPDERLYRYAGWQPAGPDSIDIAWYHSPILRLPARGDTVIGRATASWPLPLFSALWLRDFAVRAVRVPCGDVQSAGRLTSQ